MTAGLRIGTLWRALQVRPRFAGSALLGLAAYTVLRGAADVSQGTAVLLGWNIGAVANLLLTWHMMHTTDLARIKQRAVTQDQGRVMILVLVVLACAAVLLAVGTQLGQVKELSGFPRAARLALVIATIMSSWLFTQVIFMLHYAHDFYIERSAGAPDPLAFPGSPDPLYVDFLHFACVIGTSGQTADIAFVGSALRPVGTLHCILSFFFNASLLALSINVVAGVVF